MSWRVYRCREGHIMLLRGDGISRAHCPHCGREVDVEPLLATQPLEEPWIALRDPRGVYEAKGLRMVVYGARAEVRETGKGIVVELSE